MHRHPGELPPIQLDPESHLKEWEKEMKDDYRYPLGRRNHEEEEKVAFDSGATMSAVAERFDLICPAGLRRLASRYALGAEKHGDINWCLAGNDPKFQRARLNHLIKHLVAYLRNGNADDDNLAAIAWGAFALMHYEEDCRHHEIPLPKVPINQVPR